MNANEIYMDSVIRHQIGVRRYQASVVKDVQKALQEADKDLATQLRLRLARLKAEGKPIDYTSKRWLAILEDIRRQRAAIIDQLAEDVTGQLTLFGDMEVSRELSVLSSSLPIEYTFTAVPQHLVAAAVTSKPFSGLILSDWFDTLKKAEQRRLMTAIQTGMINGQTTDEIVRKVVGTRKNGYEDGILATSRRDATAIVRTATNHVSNAARDLVWQENSDVITARIWVSTLDGRTSAGCRSRDGKGTPVGNNQLPPDVLPLVPKTITPPAHFNCRSTMIAYINGVGLVGNRPYVIDTRTPNKRNIDFRRIAKEQGKTVAEVRKAWIEKNIGRTPNKTTYQEFLNRQSAAFQDEVLGKTRGQLFRNGGLTVDNFVDREGNELTLKQLAATNPEAFRKAGQSIP